MKRILFTAVLILITAVSCNVKKTYKATLIEFMAKGCPACETIEPIMKELQAEYKGLVEFKIYDVNSEEGQQMTGLYTLNGTPTLIFLDENKMEYFRLEKTIQKDVVAALLNTKTGEPGSK